MTGPLILAIESATALVGCAIGSVDGVLAATHSARGRRHAESLVPQIRFIAGQAGVEIADIEMIAVDVGPGLYTGLRVGITTARAMAHALDVPMIAVTSLETIASAVAPDLEVAVAIDARRGEVFHEIFSPVVGGTRVGSGPAVSPPEEFAAAVARRPHTVLVGDGAVAYREVFDAAGIALSGFEVVVPAPDVLLRIAATRTDRAAAPAGIRPMYLRRPDAVARWEPPT